jgi:hypothetical protein
LLFRGLQSLLLKGFYIRNEYAELTLEVERNIN